MIFNLVLIAIGLGLVAIGLAGAVKLGDFGFLVAFGGVWTVARGWLAISRGNAEHESRTTAEKIAAWYLLLLAVAVPASVVLWATTDAGWVEPVLAATLLAALAAIPVALVVLVARAIRHLAARRRSQGHGPGAIRPG